MTQTNDEAVTSFRVIFHSFLRHKTNFRGTLATVLISTHPNMQDELTCNTSHVSFKRSMFILYNRTHIVRTERNMQRKGSVRLYCSFIDPTNLFSDVEEEKFQGNNGLKLKPILKVIFPLVFFSGLNCLSSELETIPAVSNRIIKKKTF
jgi:hypothetical protein